MSTSPPQACPAPRRATTRAGASLMAHGEPAVWLTAGALAAALLMILALLALVLVQGVSTFWPAPVERLTLADGRIVMGEPARAEWFRPDPSRLQDLDEAQRARAEAQMREHRGMLHRTLLRTANYDLTDSHFTWIADYEIEQIDRPQWAVVMERMEWGRFIGFPVAFEIDDETVAEGPDQTWARFQEHHGRIRDLDRRRTHIEKHEMGRHHRAKERARLLLRRAQLDNPPPPAWLAAWRTLSEIEAAGTPEEIEHARQALHAIEERTGPPPEPFLRAVDRYEKIRAEADAAFAELSRRVAELRAEMDRYAIVMETADGMRASIHLQDVVRAYPANQLTLADKARIYLARWDEFLTDDPREANTEGGVFPAIFGTVAMTLIMSLVVVPFGVLAALYLREYARGGLLISTVRIAINNLAGVPSIVFGVFGLGFLCYAVGAFIDGGPRQIAVNPWPAPIWFLALAALAVLAVGAFFVSFVTMRAEAARARGPARWLPRIAGTLWLGATVAFVLVVIRNPFFDGFYREKLPSPTFGTGGLLWASLTLALLTLPVVIVATEEALAAVPSSMRQGSYACGASKWQTIRRIVLPRAMPGIMTGAILAMARGAGEVAPLMLVGAVKLAPELPIDGVFPFIHAERSFMHLGFHIYDLGFQSQNSEAAKPMVYTTTLLLIALIVILNLSAIALRARLRRRFKDQQF